MNKSKPFENVKELKLYRRLLTFAGTIYLLWWFAVELILPNAFNPFASRMSVACLLYAVLALSYFNNWTRSQIKGLFNACMWLMTLHYFYLFHANLGEINWIIGTYITVTAISFCFLTGRSLLAYSIFVGALSMVMLFLIPSLGGSVFIPGIATILVQANLGLRSRLAVIKNLEESNERFQLLFNSTFEGVMVHQNGRVTNVNESFVKMSGFSQAELLGKNALELIHVNDRNLATQNMKLATVPYYEATGVRKDGSYVDLEVRAKEFKYDHSVARLVTVQDITDRKRAEKERVAALTLAENVRIRDEFISIASHELRTPITSLKLQTQLIERDLQRGTNVYTSAPKVGEFVALFNRQVDRLTELVETMLDVSKISVGRLTLSKENFDLIALTKDVVATLQMQNLFLNAKHASNITIEAPEKLSIWADRNRIRQVIENMLTNALKYGSAKPISIKIFTDVSQTVLVFKDQGIGIAPEFIERIFNRFERAITAENISGLGLGLYITKQIVDAHDGSIFVESELSKGSVFTIYLPIKPEVCR